MRSPTRAVTAGALGVPGQYPGGPTAGVAAIAVLLGLFLVPPADAQPLLARPLLAQPAHLGVTGRPEWDRFASWPTAGESLAVTFDGRANDGEQTLLIRQQDVKEAWALELNGRPLGSLTRMEADLVHAVAVPAGTLRDGLNTLRIGPSKVPDDIVVHDIRLEAVPLAAVLGGSTLQVRVTDNEGAPLPGRVTIVDESDTLVPLLPLPGSRQAVRPGVAYTGGDAVRVGLRPGRYRVRATRGPEYGMREAWVSLRSGETRDLSLRLTREVATEGWVAADTHIHTLDVSGHGDATLAERMLTLAGEGVELAVATEHDRETDYTSSLATMAVAGRVTPITGREVTTKTGHFNVFPASSGDGAVAILNHPHDAHSGFTPFARANFNAVTGASRGLARPFTAMEVVNSGAMRSDWMEPVRSWFALLNRGLRVTPIGASDSHDVSRFIVGQGRTYVRAPDTDPGRIPVDATVASLGAGRVVVSLGLFAQARVGTAGPGDLVNAHDARTIEAGVSGATWTRADRVALFVNGIETAHTPIAPAASARVEKTSVTWALPARRYDYFVVVIASGPGVTDPSWAIPTPYQPTSPAWTPVVFGLTAPIYVDADGDGVFSSARAYAEQIVATHAALPALVTALSAHDQVVSSHAAELLEARGVRLDDDTMRAALATAARHVRDGVTAYLEAR